MIGARVAGRPCKPEWIGLCQDSAAWHHHSASLATTKIFLFLHFLVFALIGISSRSSSSGFRVFNPFDASCLATIRNELPGLEILSQRNPSDLSAWLVLGRRLPDREPIGLFDPVPLLAMIFWPHGMSCRPISSISAYFVH